MNASATASPHLPHAVLAIVLAALIAALGVAELVRTAKARGAQPGLGAARTGEAEVRGTNRDLGTVGTAPTSIGGLQHWLRSARSLLGRARAAAPYAPALAVIAAGAGTAACGVFLLRGATWARFATAGAIGLALAGGTLAASAWNADPAAAFALWPPVAATVGSVVVGWAVFGLVTGPAPATATARAPVR